MTMESSPDFVAGLFVASSADRPAGEGQDIVVAWSDQPKNKRGFGKRAALQVHGSDETVTVGGRRRLLAGLETLPLDHIGHEKQDGTSTKRVYSVLIITASNLLVQVQVHSTY